MEEEALEEVRELGYDIEVCELCGRPVPPGALDRAEPAAVVAPSESVRVCPMCKQELAQGTLPLDATSRGIDDEAPE